MNFSVAVFLTTWVLPKGSGSREQNFHGRGEGSSWHGYRRTGPGVRGSRNEVAISAVGLPWCNSQEGNTMNNIIWIIGAVVVVLAILSFLGLR